MVERISDDSSALADFGMIPKDWSLRSLEQIVDSRRPISYGIVQTGRLVQGGVRCVRVVDITHGRVDPTALVTTSSEISAVYGRTVLCKGDLIVALRGKVGELAVVDDELVGANLTRGVALLSSTAGHESLYLSYALSSPRGKRLFERNLNGSALQEIPIATLRKIRVALPPLGEQRAIAAALFDVDALLTSFERLLVKNGNLRQATMSRLLTRQIRLPGFAGTWDEAVLEDVTVKIGSGITPTGGVRVYKQTGRPLLRSQNISWGTLLLDDVAFIDDAMHKSFAGTEIQTGDVFLNITGASIGRSAVADDRVRGGNVNQHVCIIRPHHALLDARYLNYFLLSAAGQQQIESFQAGGNRQGLNYGQIRSFSVRCPPLAEQCAIAAVLSDMDAEIAALEQRRDKTRLLKQAMMQELLTGRTRLV